MQPTANDLIDIPFQPLVYGSLTLNSSLERKLVFSEVDVIQITESSMMKFYTD